MVMAEPPRPKGFISVPLSRRASTAPPPSQTTPAACKCLPAVRGSPASAPSRSASTSALPLLPSVFATGNDGQARECSSLLLPPPHHFSMVAEGFDQIRLFCILAPVARHNKNVVFVLDASVSVIFCFEQIKRHSDIPTFDIAIFINRQGCQHEHMRIVDHHSSPVIPDQSVRVLATHVLGLERDRMQLFTQFAVALRPADEVLTLPASHPAAQQHQPNGRKHRERCHREELQPPRSAVEQVSCRSAKDEFCQR